MKLACVIVINQCGDTGNGVVVCVYVEEGEGGEGVERVIRGGGEEVWFVRPLPLPLCCCLGHWEGDQGEEEVVGSVDGDGGEGEGGGEEEGGCKEGEGGKGR